MQATITSKGQITLPKSLREKLGLSTGERIEFLIDEENNVRLVVKHESVTRLKGMLPKPKQAVTLHMLLP